MARHFLFGLVQLLFALTWTVYVVFLPSLAEASGIPRAWVVWLLLADQATFVLMDYVMGVAADRVAARMRRLAPWLAAVNAFSCAAFILIPHVAGPGSAPLLIAAIVAWTASASVLRAPLFAAIAQAAEPAQVTWLSHTALLGLGVAGALAPALSAQLRGIDPRLPFIFAGVGLAVATAALAWYEKARTRPADKPAPEGMPRAPGIAFFVAVALLCLGFQVHTAINSAPAYLRFAQPGELDRLMPAYWVGFSLAMMPASWLARRTGAAAVLAIGAVLGALAMAAVQRAPDILWLVAAQLASGVGWALVIGSAVNVAVEAGRSGREGRFSGTVFALVAFGAMLRLAVVGMAWHKSPAFAPALEWLPAVFWALAATLCVAMLARAGTRQIASGRLT